MTDTVFIRLLADDDKETALNNAIASFHDPSSVNSKIYTVNPESFSQVPGSPFAYWVSDRIRQLFTELPPFESEGRTVKQGLATADDFRFVRLGWEVLPEIIVTGTAETTPEEFRQQTFEDKCWVPFAKGGEYSPYYADIHLIVNWAGDGKQIKQHIVQQYPYLNGKWEWVAKNSNFYFCPGLTYPRRSTSGFSIRALPAGCIFADKGTAAFVETESKISALGILFSRPYQSLIEIRLAAGDEVHSGTAGRSYEVGIIQALPWSNLSEDDIRQFTDWVKALIQGVRDRNIKDETAKSFIYPPLFIEKTIKGSAEYWHRLNEKRDCELLEQAAKVDIRVAEILGVTAAERENNFGKDAATLCTLPIKELDSEFDHIYKQSIHDTIREEIEESGGNRQIAVKSYYVSRHLEVLAKSLNVNPKHIAKVAAERHLIPDGVDCEFAQTGLSYTVGCTFGRWDIRFATGEKQAPELPDPFAPLPACSPGMLTDKHGLPLRETPTNYPIQIDWNGILVDDPDHPDDIIRRVRDVLEVIWGDKSEAIEKEACEILEVKELRDYFRKPGNGGFWSDHIKRYSKSRRKAPIYWLLQSSKKNYAIWIYYHRLDKDILFKALINYVEPKLRLEESNLEQLRSQKTAAGTAGMVKQLEKQIDRQESLISELQDFQDKLRRAANLNLEPDLNDGVVLNIAPLWELVPWNEAKKYWLELTANKYEWSSMGKQLKAKGLIL